MEIDIAFRVEVETICGLLDDLDYYQLLKIEHGARSFEVKEAFFRESRTFHPDRFFGADDEAFKSSVLKIYKRIAEGYGVLKDPVTRGLYDEQLAKDGAARFDRSASERASRGSSAPDAVAKTVQGKKFLKLGLDRLQKKDYPGAVMNLQFALNTEPGNEAIQARLGEARVLLEEEKEKNPTHSYKLRL